MHRVSVRGNIKSKIEKVGCTWLTISDSYKQFFLIKIWDHNSCSFTEGQEVEASNLEIQRWTRPADQAVFVSGNTIPISRISQPVESFYERMGVLECIDDGFVQIEGIGCMPYGDLNEEHIMEMIGKLVTVDVEENVVVSMVGEECMNV